MKDHVYITCRELIDFLMEYIDGTLPPARRAEFERHLAVCPSCVAYLDSYTRSVRLGKLAFAPTDEPATSAAPASLVRAVRDARLKRG